MNRRTVLGAVGTLVSLPAIGYTTRRDGTTVSVRFWRTPRAARYDGVERRLFELLTRSLDLPHWTLDVSSGGVVDVETDRAATAVTEGRWPRAILRGAAGVGEVDPVWDVNLLVTDGTLEVAPTGYGVPHAAAIGGASKLAQLEPIGSIDEPVPVSDGTFAAQVVLHEVGHALGLSHADGRHYTDGEASVVTPMLSAYGWQSGGRSKLGRCNAADDEVDVTDPTRRRLDLQFSSCARRKLREYDGQHVS